MAWALASTDVWSVLMDATRESKVTCKVALLALFTVLSPMASMRRGVGGAEEGRDGGGGDGGRPGEEGLDRDTRLSRASMPKTAGPRLRSS